MTCNDWRSLNYVFRDDDIWKKRIKKLSEIGFCSFDSFIKNCEEQNTINPDEKILKKLVNCFPEFDCDFYYSKVKNKKNNFLYYSIPQISRYIFLEIISLSDEVDRFFENRNSVCIGLVDAFMPNILRVFMNTLEFEYSLYLKGSAKKNCSETLLDFVCYNTTNPIWIKSFFEDYPVARRRVINMIRNYLKFIAQLFSDIKQDYQDLVIFFTLPSDIKIGSISSCLGDLHNNGKSTCKISFLRPSINIYYKPRNPGGEIFFDRVIDYLWSIGLKQSLTKVRYLAKKDHFWQQELITSSFNSKNEIKEFYYNQGINCSIAYVFNIEDLISDNIVACSTKPGYYDLEILLRPQYKKGNHYLTNSQSAKLYSESVMKTGLIPEFGFVSFNEAGYSNAGLSKNRNENYQNLPLYNNSAIPIDLYCEDFEQGFEFGYRFFMENRNKIESKVKSIIKLQSNNIESRLLIRYTYIYSYVFETLSGPRYCRNYIEYYKILEYLWRGYDDAMLTEDVIQSEISQIDNSDYPLFYSKVDSKDLFDSYGNIVKRDYFNRNGIDNFQNKLKRLDDRILLEQLNLIRRSLIVHNNYDRPIELTYKEDSKNTILSQIATYLESKNLEDSKSNYFAYLDYTITKNSQWSQYIQGSDFFQGLNGVGVFFAANYKHSKVISNLNFSNKIFLQTGQLLESSRLKLLDSPSSSLGITHFPMSLLYYSYLCKEILGCDQFEISEENFAFIREYIANSIRKDSDIDYLFGSVGAALLLMAYEKQNRSVSFSEEISKIGNHIKSNVEFIDHDKITLTTKSFYQWGGFGHGNSSLAYLFFRLFSYFGDQQYLSLAHKALNYDQFLYDSKLKHWRKTYKFNGDFHEGWASGSAGIGLSRYLINSYFRNSFMKKEIDIVKKKLESTFEYYFLLDHSICSGFLGMLEVYKIIFGENKVYCYWLDRYMGEIKSFSDIKSGGWEKKQIISGMFYGVSGIGYNIIKLSNKKLNLPSLLWL